MLGFFYLNSSQSSNNFLLGISLLQLELCRLAVEAWGLKNCTQKEEWFSDTVTAVMVPPYIDSSAIVRRAWQRYNLSLGLGLNKVAGKVFRIGHLGNLNDVCFYIFCPISFIIPVI